MFTGIIGAVSTITTVQKLVGGMLCSITKPAGWQMRAGDSISINGICSTVKKVGRQFTVEYMPETLAKTNAATWRKGDAINLEQSLTLRDRLNGHFVTGHIDSVARITSLKLSGNSCIFTITLPLNSRFLLKLIAPKGSVAVDGISLTVVEVSKKGFTVHIIPYTLQHTNLQDKGVGDTVNIECDILAKYIAQQLTHAYAGSRK